jgi:RND family efflux transporter MFP subunit
VLHETLPKTIRVLGRTLLRPESEAVVASPVEGRLVATEEYVSPSLGQPVKRGQVLVGVEQTIGAPEKISLGSESAVVQSLVQQAKAELELARKERDRVAGLKGIVPDKEILQAENAVVVTTAKYEGLKKQASVFESATKTTGPQSDPRLVLVRSPLDGVVAQTHVTLGEYVLPDKQLYHIVDLSSVLLQADVFENDIAAVAKTARARVILDAYPDEEFEASFVSIATAVDPLTRTLHVLILVPNPDRKLVAEMFADIFIETGDSLEGLTVPKTAIANQDGQSIVYLKTGGEQFTAQPVRVVYKYGDRALIEALPDSPAHEGARVVTQGIYQVRMSGAAQPPAAAASGQSGGPKAAPTNGREQNARK